MDNIILFCSFSIPTVTIRRIFFFFFFTGDVFCGDSDFTYRVFGVVGTLNELKGMQVVHYNQPIVTYRA